MGAKYTTISASGYNSSPPPDDGSQVATNLITWSAQKTKLADPVKNLADAINTALVSAFDYSVRQITSSDSTVAGDHMRCVEIAPTVTTAVTVSLGDAATMTSTYRVFIKNSSAISQTVGRVTGGDTIDGVAGNVVLAPGEGRIFQTNSTPNGYLTNSRSTPFSHGADVASSGTINLDTATGELVDVTGTTTITAITLSDGKWAMVRFTGILTLTHGASLVLPGAANITTAAGDYAIFRGYAAGIVRCASYSPASGVFIGNKTANTILAGPTSGAAAAPTFRALVGAESSLVLLCAAKTASSSASISFTSSDFDWTLYDEYIIRGIGVRNATDAVYLTANISLDGGSTWKTGASDYAWSVNAILNATLASNGSISDSRFVISDLGTGQTNNASYAGQFTLHIPKPNAALFKTIMTEESHHGPTPNFSAGRCVGTGTYIGATTAINGVRIQYNVGNIAEGTFYAYGVRKT